MKNHQTTLVMSLLGIIFIICFGYISNIINKASKNGAEIQTKTLMDTVEHIHIESLLNNKDNLPLIAVFKDGEMYLKAGSPSKTYIYNGNVKIPKSLPISGEIVVSNNDKVIATNIKIRNYMCNSLKEDEVICKKA